MIAMCHGQLLNDALRHARKEHRCDECGGRIYAGREYHAQSVAFDGNIDAVKLCLLCSAASVEFSEAGECYEGGWTREYLRDELRAGGWRALRAKLRGTINRIRDSYRQRKQSALGAQDSKDEPQ